ncbi:hypothetical protein CBOM_07874 [Ceraceosorus bombacis]|uniref:Uncharacterized protein n=1 Tax=Ceraceosorus bombacis TaxID=401625 RepID=A0A0P1BI52_9BASI|nr:hypothetical protein CBOM_07874 [Ceraceosorus bombacis]
MPADDVIAECPHSGVKEQSSPFKAQQRSRLVVCPLCPSHTIACPRAVLRGSSARGHDENGSKSEPTKIPEHCTSHMIKATGREMICAGGCEAFRRSSSLSLRPVAPNVRDMLCYPIRICPEPR